MPVPLEDLWQMARRMDLEAFQARYPHPFLIRLDQPEAAASDSDADHSAAAVGPLPTRGRPSTLPDAVPVPKVGPLALAVEVIKCSGRGPRDVLSVGRARDNDVVVEARSVSLRHASLLTQGPIRWQLRDENSRNGVWLNGSRLAAGAVLGLRSSDVIGLGDVPCAFLLAAELMELLPALCGGL